MRDYPIDFLARNPGLEAMELRDIGAADLSPTIPEHLGSIVTPQDVDAMAEREANRPPGYVDAMCLGCGCALYVPANERCGDVLCPGCRAAGEALAADDDDPDDEPDPPGAAIHPDHAAYVQQVKAWPDDRHFHCRRRHRRPVLGHTRPADGMVSRRRGRIA